MPSTINDFSKRVKKMAPDVGLAVNYNGEKDYNAVRSNPFKRSVTLNNAGNPARTGWLVHIKLDTKSIYALNQCSFTFADLRVYDSNQVTELQHWVEAPNTEWTSIFVRVNLPASALKTIWLYYGNPGLESKSNINTLLLYGSSNIFSSWRLRYWGKANEPSRETGGDGFPDAWPAKYLRNNKGGPRFDFYQDNATIVGGPYPTYFHNQANGLPEIRFDGSNDFLRHGSYPNVAIIRNNRPYHIFAVAARADTGANWLLYGEGAAVINQRLLFGWRNNTTLSLAQFGNDLDVTVSGYTSKTWQLIEGLHHNSYHGIALNGSIIGSNTNGTGLNGDRILRLGETLNGGLAEVLIFEPSSSGLTSDDLNNVRIYLRVKYALYSTSTDPTVTVNSQQASGSTEWDYTSYAPFAEFRENIKAEIATYPESTGTVKITNLMQKTLAVGNSVETWSASSVDKTGRYISSHGCRKVTATTSANPDTVKIERLDGANNRGDLGKFEIENIVETTTYSSTDDDYIEFELNPTDASLIDDTNSYIRFQNSANTLSYQSALSNNENLLSDGILNIVRIKKSDFTKSGTGDWTDASYNCVINIQTSSGSQDVFYGVVRLVRRFDTAPELDYNNPIRLRNGVSSDNDVSYYLTTMHKGRIIDKKIQDKEFELDTEDYLKIIQYKKFSDFDSFPSRFVMFDLNVEDGGSNQALRFYTFAMKKILGFIFPESLLDIDLDLLPGDDLIDGFPADGLTNLQFFYILGSEQVEDKIETILKACAGMLWYEPETGKITARNGYKIWLEAAGQLGTPHNITNIVKDGYKEADSGDTPIYNYIAESATMALRNRSSSSVGMQRIGTGGGLGTIPPTGSNGSATLFLAHDAMTKGDLYTVLTNNIRIADWNFWTDDKSGYDNSGISIKDIAMIDDQIAVTFRNITPTEKTLAAMTFYSDFLSYTYVSNFLIDGEQQYQAEFSGEEKNSQSIARRGVQRYEIDDRFSFVKLGESIFAGVHAISDVTRLPYLHSAVVDYLDTAELVQAEIFYDPYLHPGKYVSIRNKEGRLVYGYVTALEHYSKGGEYRSIVTVREIS